MSLMGPNYPADLVEALASRDVDEALLALAHQIAELGGPADVRARTLLVLAVLASMEAGSTLVPLDGLGELLGRLGVPPADAALARALVERGDPILGSVGEARPLVRVGAAIGAQASVKHERRVGEWMGARSELPPVDVSAELADLDLRPARGLKLNAAQREAVRASAARGFTLVTGGPGTGKTSIVVAMIRLWARRGVGAEAIALAAPTGKAKARLESAVAEALASIETPSSEDLALREHPPSASTLHRLLGWRQGAFRWGGRHPLPHRLVIVDEGSMIDLALMRSLLDAVGPDTRLVMLGDADQLPSVEVGAVFRDLVALGGAVTLSESFRMRQDEPGGRAIFEVAQAVNGGVIPAIPAPVELAHRGVERVELSRPAARQRLIERHLARVPRPSPEPIAWLDGVPDAPGRARLEAMIAAVESRRILCVTRSAARPTGVDAVNELARRILAERGRGSARWAHGDPVLVEHNDYERELWNGDLGVVALLAEPERAPYLAAVFRRGGELVAVPVEALSGVLSHAWAMTVHKAQGSELDELVLLLPLDPIPLFTRELLYTAITRARRSVILAGPAAVLEQGAQRKLIRVSGLAEHVPRRMPGAS